MREFIISVKKMDDDSDVNTYTVTVNSEPQIKKFNFLFQTIVPSVISGILAGIFLLFCPSIYISINEANEEKEKLSNLHLGLSTSYTQSLLGVPIVDFVEDNDISFSYYKLKNFVILLGFDNEMVVSYMIFQKEQESLYRVKPWGNDYLTNFVYSDYGMNPEFSDGNVPANNLDYFYYYERYYGGNPGNYNYYVIGNYILIDDAVSGLAFNFVTTEPLTNVESYRTIGKPNVFGMIKGGYEDKIGMIPLIDNLGTYNEIIFSDWW